MLETVGVRYAKVFASRCPATAREEWLSTHEVIAIALDVAAAFEQCEVGYLLGG